MKAFLTSTLCLLLSLSLFGAEGVRTLPDSAEAMGMGGGRLVNLSDPSVIHTNPATLADISDTLLQINIQGWHGKTDFTRADGTTSSMIDPWKPLGSVYITYPLNERLTAGLGLTAPFGVSINWPENSAFRYASTYDAKLETFAINPALGLKINDNASLGFGLDIYRSNLELDQAFPWSVATGFPFPDGNMHFKGTGWGLGAYVGFNFTVADIHRFAIVGRLPVTVDYDGDFEVTSVPAAVAGVFTPTSVFQSEIEHPGSIGVGYGIDLTERLTFGIDFEWIQNSTHDDLPLNIGSNQALLGGQNALLLNWEDSISIGAGLEYQFTEALTLRGGYLYSDSPMNSQNYTPAVPADDRHIISAGVGYTQGVHTVDFAYSLLTMDSSDIAGNVQPAFNGNYDYDWHILTISYTRKF
ncbi:MAG: outer membrane protein transport protein [Verrucomicrobiota bacterium]